MKRAIAASLGHTIPASATHSGSSQGTPQSSPKRKSARLSNIGSERGNETWERRNGTFDSGIASSSSSSAAAPPAAASTAALRSGTANAKKRARATLRDLGFELAPKQLPTDAPKLKPQQPQSVGGSSYAWDGRPSLVRSPTTPNGAGAAAAERWHDGVQCDALPPARAFGDCAQIYGSKVREPHAETIIQWLDKRSTNYHVKRQAAANKNGVKGGSATTASTALHEKPGNVPARAVTSVYAGKDYGVPSPAASSKSNGKASYHASKGGGPKGSSSGNWLITHSKSKTSAGKRRAAADVITVDDSDDDVNGGGGVSGGSAAASASSYKTTTAGASAGAGAGAGTIVDDDDDFEDTHVPSSSARQQSQRARESASSKQHGSTKRRNGKRSSAAAAGDATAAIDVEDYRPPPPPSLNTLDTALHAGKSTAGAGVGARFEMTPTSQKRKRGVSSRKEKEAGSSRGNAFTIVSDSENEGNTNNPVASGGATVFLYCNSRYKVIVNVLSRMGKWERKERRGTP